MSKVTLILDYEDGNEPKLHAHQEILGGELIGIAWSDLQDEIEILENKIEKQEKENAKI